MDKLFLDKKEVVAYTGLSDTTIWHMEKNGKFPKRRKLSINKAVWLREDIITWARSLGTA